MFAASEENCKNKRAKRTQKSIQHSCTQPTINFLHIIQAANIIERSINKLR